jgi:phenylalanyl-tRNA synthetase alpha chain
MHPTDKIVSDARAAFDAVATVADLEQAKSRFLGKSGALTELLKGLGKLSAEERPKAGAAINEAKVRVEELLQARRDAILAAELDQRLAAESIDVTLPGRRQSGGGLHPISRAQEHIERLFASMGSRWPTAQIENDFYNFTALRMFPDHLAEHADVLRGGFRTGPAHAHLARADPLHAVAHRPSASSGRVYRVDHDATHSPMFHQIEGLWVDEGISLADLKGTITQFCRAFFEARRHRHPLSALRLPFVEPGVEIDMEWERKDSR